MHDTLEGGRVRQKLRTRNALIAAARDLIASGASPTVEDAAAAADISRTTAYRYFRNQADLLVAAHPEIERRSLLPATPPEDPAERLEIVVREIQRILIDTEAQQRTMLRLSLEENKASASGEPATKSSLLLRQGRAIGWLSDALAPLRARLPKRDVDRLVLAIRATIGIEAFVWLVDVAGLSRKEALATMRWSAGALLEKTLRAPVTRNGRGRR